MLPVKAVPVTLLATVNRLLELLVQLWLAAGMTLLALMLSGPAPGCITMPLPIA